MIKMLVNVAGVNACWLACVMGAAAGYHWLGPVTVLAFFIIHLWLVRPRRPELLLAGALLITGFAVDTLLGLVGAIDPARGPLYPGLWSPPWMVALWVNFGTSLSTSLRWLEGRPLVAGLLGAAGGPSAYAAGAGLGAARLGQPEYLSLIMVGVAWGLVLPAAVATATRLRNASKED